MRNFDGSLRRVGVDVIDDGRKLFRELASKGRTVFLSTHSLDVAQEVCDRVGILYRGKIVALGKVEDLMNSGDQDLEAVFLRITEEEESAYRDGGSK